MHDNDCCQGESGAVAIGNAFNVCMRDAVVVFALGARLPAHELLAAVLAYRAAHYLLPLALPAYGPSEAAAGHADCAASTLDRAPPRRVSGIRVRPSDRRAAARSRVDCIRVSLVKLFMEFSFY